MRELTPLGARGHGEGRAERGRRPRATFDAHCDVRHQPPQGHLPRSRDPGLAVPCASLITGRSVRAPIHPGTRPPEPCPCHVFRSSAITARGSSGRDTRGRRALRTEETTPALCKIAWKTVYRLPSMSYLTSIGFVSTVSGVRSTRGSHVDRTTGARRTAGTPTTFSRAPGPRTS